MANVMLKSLNFIKILNGRLSFNLVKHLHGQCLTRSYTRHRQGYATAAYKLLPSENTNEKNDDARSNIVIKDLDSINKALYDIDYAIRRCGRTTMKNIHEIFTAVTSKEITTSTHGLYLLRGCKYCYDVPPSKRIDLVNQIWNKYQELGIEFDVRHYNALFDVHVTNGLDFNPAEILSSMEDINIEPNKTTYMLIMKKYCQDGNISGASEILEHMKEKQIPVDEKVFNYLIEGHIKNNDIPGAKEIVEVMRSSNLEPTSDTHTILACGYAATGDKDEMMAHLRQCGEVDSIQNYLEVIETLASSGHHQHIDDVLSLIQHKELFKEEFINSAINLMHKNFIEVAYKLVSLTYSPEFNKGINIFVKQLIKMGRADPSEVVNYIERIHNGNMYGGIFILASKVAAENGLLNYSVALFKRMQEIGNYLRPSSFWSLFTAMEDKPKPGDVWLVLKKMTELGIPCDFATYTEFVFPKLGVPHPNDVLHDVQATGQSPETAADALFLHYCGLGEIDYANLLVEMYPVKVSNKLDINNFVSLYHTLNTQSMPKYLKLLKYMLMADNKHNRISDFQGRLLAELIVRNLRLIENLLNKYEDIIFSDYTLKVCEQELMEREPHLLHKFKKLKILNSGRENIFQQENISVEDENKYIAYLQAQDISCKPFLVKRINYHIKEKNVPRILELQSLFDKLEFEYPPLMLSNLFGIWSAVGDIEKAKEFRGKLKTEFPSFKLDIARSLEYVTLFLRYEKVDDYFEVLKQVLAEPYTIPSKDRAVRCIRRLNKILTDTQDIEYIKKTQDILLPLSNELGSKKAILESGIDVYLLRNDLESAYEEFRNTVATHHVPANLSNFYKRCIIAGEKSILQKVIDLTTSCSGKSLALLELAVAFIETSHMDKALKVIESLGQETSPKVLDDICSKLVNQNKIAELEELIFMTKSLNHVNRENLYCHAFRACAERKDFQRALKLFDDLKKEVIEPSPGTINFFQRILKKNNQPIPLSIISTDQSEITSMATEATKIFLGHLEAGNAEEALKELNDLKKGYIRTLSIKTLTNLVDLCLEKNCVKDLSLNTHAMSYIIENAKDVFKPILEKYAKEGDVEKFNAISMFMPDFSLMGLAFNNYFCKAFISSGRYESLLSQLEQHMDKKNKLFSIDAFEELLSLPELEDKILNLAVKYIDYNYNLPMAVVWAHYFSKENYEKAAEITKNFSLNLDRVHYIVLKNIRQNENISLAKEYVNFVKLANVRPREKERAYGAALDLLVLKGMYDEAVDLVIDSERQNLLLHKFYLSTLVTLKNTLEKDNKPVPFTLPSDVAKENSGSE